MPKTELTAKQASGVINYYILADLLRNGFFWGLWHRHKKTAREVLVELGKFPVSEVSDRQHRWYWKARRLLERLLKAENRDFWRKSIPYERCTAEYHNWRIDCLNRDKWACQDCGDKKKLNVHHIKSYIDHIKLRTDRDNGITLCLKCHVKAHKRLKYGQ